MNTSKPDFLVALMQELMASMNNWFGPENWDADRFGPYHSSLKSSVVSRFNELFPGKLAVVPVDISQHQIHKLARIRDSIEGLASFYELLADESSKQILVKVLAYRFLGHKNVKLPLNTEAYWSTRNGTRSLIKSADSIKVKFPDIVLNHLSLDEIGYPIELYYAPGGVMVTFILKQYEYGKRNPKIHVREGDYVIDAGGCWGDTALYFAHEAGERGRVYTFEFTPENVGILERNVNLNPRLSERIELVQKALWDKTGEQIEYYPHGPATSLAPDRQSNTRQEPLRAATISIDDFVKEKQLPRLDFIKMDIEGAELGALKGAEESIRRFKPELAISVYHREDDFIEIPNYLHNLALGYEFFLDHFTIYGEETILFATPKAA